MLTSVRRIRGRAVLTLSDGTQLSMPRAMLRERPYRGGTPFDMASFTAFLRERSLPFAMEKAVGLLAMRARTEKELRDALRQNAYPEETVERVIARMGEAGYIDDADFAGHWAASRSAKGMGSRRIAMELRRKGVSGDTIDSTLNALDEEDVFDGALRYARKAARGRDLSQISERQKVSAALARRGYDFSTAREAIAALISEEDSE